VQSVRGEQAGLAFTELNLTQRKSLVQCTLARPDAWAHWPQRYDTDHAVQGLQEIVLLAVQSYSILIQTYSRAVSSRTQAWFTRLWARRAFMARMRGRTS
jgi:hypothetical protein